MRLRILKDYIIKENEKNDLTVFHHHGKKKKKKKS